LTFVLSIPFPGKAKVAKHLKGIATTARSSGKAIPGPSENPHIMADHPHPADMGHGYGETPEQHARHAAPPQEKHFGLPPYSEAALFYVWAILSWGFEIAASVTGSYYSTGDHRFIATATVCMFCSWAAWWQTAIQMMQRASWVRDESNLTDRRRYLYLAVRLTRLMLVCLPCLTFELLV